jgi:3-oxoacyl-(acyl-carrier-protein) synthase
MSGRIDAVRQADAIVVTGVGIVSSLGTSAGVHFERLLAGASGIRPAVGFDTEGLRSRIAGQALDFDPLLYVDRDRARMMDRCAQLGVAAALEALKDASLLPGSPAFDPARIAVSIGTAQGGRISDEEALAHYFARDRRSIPVWAVPKIMPSAPAAWTALLTGARGPGCPISNACATGLNALGWAMQTLRADPDIDAVLAGAADAPLTRSMVAAWSATRAISPTNEPPSDACRPFDAARNGFVLAEGAAVAVVERASAARARGARIVGELRGYAATNDAHDIVAPEPSGAAAGLAAGRALARAGVEPGSLAFVSAHGTGTRLNDVAETAALRHALGASAATIPVVAFKAALGHAMGAAGAIEACTALLALQRGELPPSLNRTTPDPECDLNVSTQKRSLAPGAVALVESLAFGGSNAALVISA